jgi:hypothetical protein
MAENFDTWNATVGFVTMYITDKITGVIALLTAYINAAVADWASNKASQNVDMRNGDTDHKVVNLGDPTDPKDAINKQYLDTSVLDTLNWSRFWPVTYPYMNGLRIREVGEPEDANDATTKAWVETKIAAIEIPYNYVYNGFEKFRSVPYTFYYELPNATDLSPGNSRVFTIELGVSFEILAFAYPEFNSTAMFAKSNTNLYGIVLVGGSPYKDISDTWVIDILMFNVGPTVMPYTVKPFMHLAVNFLLV